MNAAERVFDERGMSGATIAQIAAGAGVAAGTVYLYFPSKAHLLAAIAERFAAGYLAYSEQLAARAEEGDVEALIDDVISSLVDYVIANSTSFALLVKEPANPEVAAQLAASSDRLQQAFLGAVKVGSELGLVHVEDPEMTVTLLFRAVEGTLRAALLFGREIDRDRLVAAAGRLVRAGLGVQ